MALRLDSLAGVLDLKFRLKSGVQGRRPRHERTAQGWFIPVEVPANKDPSVRGLCRGPPVLETTTLKLSSIHKYLNQGFQELIAFLSIAT